MESESNSLNSHTTDQHDLTMAKDRDIPDIKIKSWTVLELPNKYLHML